jgi:hypothetical protein
MVSSVGRRGRNHVLVVSPHVAQGRHRRKPHGLLPALGLLGQRLQRFLAGALGDAKADRRQHGDADLAGGTTVFVVHRLDQDRDQAVARVGVVAGHRGGVAAHLEILVVQPGDDHGRQYRPRLRVLAQPGQHPQQGGAGVGALVLGDADDVGQVAAVDQLAQALHRCPTHLLVGAFQLLEQGAHAGVLVLIAPGRARQAKG